MSLDSLRRICRSQAESTNLAARSKPPEKRSLTGGWALPKKGMAFFLATITANGCASLKPQITSDAIDFNRAVEHTNNEVAFLNVIRSYKRSPRHYTSISDIKGNFTVTTAAGLSSTLGLGSTKVANASGSTSSSLVGSVAASESIAGVSRTLTSAADTITPTLAASYAKNPNYTIAVLESQEFYNGILKPIDLQTVTLFRQQGWHSELLANLLFEHLVLTIKKTTSNNTAGGDPEKKARELRAIFKIRNDPRSQGWTDLADIINLQTSDVRGNEEILAVAPNLSPQDLAKVVEQKLSVRRCTRKDNSIHSPSSSATDAERQGARSKGIKPMCKEGEDYLIYRTSASKVGLNLFREEKLSAATIEHIKAGFQGNPMISREQAEALLKEYLDKCANKSVGTIFYFSDSLSTSRTKSAGTDSLCRTAQLHISARSTDGVVYYVGEYVRAIVDAKKPPILIGSDNAPMFVVSNDNSETAILATHLYGEDYYVPRAAPGRTLQVLGFIQQLLNLHKKSEDLPKAQLIQIQ